MLRRIMTIAALAAATMLTGRSGDAQQTPSVTAPPNGRQFDPPYYVFSPDIPHDIVTYAVPVVGIQGFADSFAWQAFIALNWPVPNPIVQFGVPDRENVIGGFRYTNEGGTTTMPNRPVVWETYKHSDDIYLDPPTAPSPFDAAERIPTRCLDFARQNPAASHRVLTRTAKISEVLKGVEQADGNRLIDQNGENVWYEVKLNRVYYDYVVRNGFYASANQGNEGISFPLSSNDIADAATIKVKAAWKVMGGPGSRQPDDARRFYTTPALVIDPTTGECHSRLLGLVGLHIVIKSRQLPLWLWATFEQVDNAPDQTAGPVAGQQYNFFDTKCGANCPPVNTPPAKGSNVPTQVMRVTPVDVDAKPKNTDYQAALKTLRSDNVVLHAGECAVEHDAHEPRRSGGTEVPRQHDLGNVPAGADTAERLHQLPRHVRGLDRSRLPADQRLSAAGRPPPHHRAAQGARRDFAEGAVGDRADQICLCGNLPSRQASAALRPSRRAISMNCALSGEPAPSTARSIARASSSAASMFCAS